MDYLNAEDFPPQGNLEEIDFMGYSSSHKGPRKSGGRKTTRKRKKHTRGKSKKIETYYTKNYYV